MFRKSLITRLFLATTEVAVLRGLVKLQGAALEKSTARGDRRTTELEDARAELRSAVEELEERTREHAAERDRWTARVNEITAEAERFAVNNAELRRANEDLATRERLLTSERDHWKGKANELEAEIAFLRRCYEAAIGTPPVRLAEVSS